MTFVRRSAWMIVVLALSTLAACERESRDFPRPAPGAEVGDPETAAAMIAHDERNAYALATGKKLWSWYNCSGCHANGGGGSGPALMDDVWIYGGDATSIFETISKGRPNGMPAFGNGSPRTRSGRSPLTCGRWRVSHRRMQPQS
jgi:cytochrome c oxidase cbb3-type subunit 3